MTMGAVPGLWQSRPSGTLFRPAVAGRGEAKETRFRVGVATMVLPPSRRVAGPRQYADDQCIAGQRRAGRRADDLERISVH